MHGLFYVVILGINLSAILVILIQFGLVWSSLKLLIIFFTLIN
jgi:hypothetical protein